MADNDLFLPYSKAVLGFDGTQVSWSWLHKNHQFLAVLNACDQTIHWHMPDCTHNEETSAQNPHHVPDSIEDVCTSDSVPKVKTRIYPLPAYHQMILWSTSQKDTSCLSSGRGSGISSKKFFMQKMIKNLLCFNNTRFSKRGNDNNQSIWYQSTEKCDNEKPTALSDEKWDMGAKRN